MWLDRYFPNVKRIFTKEKHFCANPQTILIDDTDAKIEKFREHGGLTVTFPQPWNQATLGGDIANVLSEISLRVVYPLL
jgi:hypothetical protein